MSVTNYLKKVVASNLKLLEFSTEERNVTLNKVVYKIFQFSDYEYIQQEKDNILNKITHISLKNGLSDIEIKQTANSAYKASQKNKKVIPINDFELRIRDLKVKKEEVLKVLRDSKKEFKSFDDPALQNKFKDNISGLELQIDEIDQEIRELKEANKLHKDKVEEERQLKETGEIAELQGFITDLVFEKKNVFVDDQFYILADDKERNINFFAEKNLEIFCLSLFDLETLKIVYSNIKNLKVKFLDHFKFLKPQIPKARYTQDPLKPKGSIIIHNGVKHINIYDNSDSILHKCKPDKQLTTQSFPLIYRHLKHIYTEHLEFVLDLFAYKMQNPKELTITTLVHKTTEGVGKGLLFYLLQKIFGYENSVSLNHSSYASNYTSYCDKTIIMFEEVELKDKKTGSILRNLVADKYITKTNKYTPDAKIENLGFYFIFSNQTLPIFIPADDRRFYVVEQMKKISRTLGKQLYDLYEKSEDLAEIENFVSFCLARDTNYEKIKVTSTSAKQKMIEYTLGENYNILKNIFSGDILLEIDSKKEIISYVKKEKLEKIQNRIIFDDKKMRIIGVDVVELFELLHNKKITGFKIKNIVQEYFTHVYYKTFRINKKSCKGYEVFLEKEEIVIEEKEEIIEEIPEKVEVPQMVEEIKAEKTYLKEVLKLTDVRIPIDEGLIFLDLETSGPGKKGALDPKKNTIELIQLNVDGEIILATPRGCADKEIFEFFESLFCEDRWIIGHNIQFDLKTILAKTGLLPRNIFCTMVAEQLIHLTRVDRPKHLRGNSLKETVLRYFNVDLDKEQQSSDWSKEWTKKQLEYAKNDVKYLPELFELQIKKLNEIHSSEKENEIGLKNRVAELEMKMIPIMSEMTLQGMELNKEYINSEIKKSCDSTEKIAFNIKSKHVIKNLNSPKQLLELFKKNNLNIFKTDKETLFCNQHEPLVKKIIEYKEASQIAKNLKKYNKKIIHPQWVGVAAPTGRMTAKQPSVQNIPRDLKNEFFDKKLTLVGADYPAIELRIAAAYTQEKVLIDAFNNDIDVHKLTASKILGISIDQITKEQRQMAKAPNYGLLYGMGVERFRDYARFEYGVDLTVQEAKTLRNRFFEAYPQLKQWHLQTGSMLNHHDGGIFPTLFNRMTFYRAGDYTTALNMPIQGTGADMFKIAAVNLYKELKNIDASIYHLIHDEIVVKTTPENVEKVSQILKKCMEDSAKALLPNIKTECDIKVQLGENNENNS